MVGPARILRDRYEIGEQIASGGMGHVVAARDLRVGRDVAVKLLRDELTQDARFVERFRREARAAGALTHPNIAAVYDYDTDGTTHFIVMERCSGRSLAQLVAEEGPLEPARAAHIATQIADALDHAHSAGVVHRDIKPANVVVGDGDRVKVTDFGIARALGDARLTTTGMVLGSAHYIAPEQASGGDTSPASDVYSLGVVTFEMLTGSVPFTGDSPIGVAMQHVTNDVPVPSGIEPGVPAPLDAVVARATAKEPDARYADGASMAEALRHALAPNAGPRGSDTKVLPPAATVWPIPGGRWNPRKVGRIVVASFVILGLLAAGLLLLGPSPELRPRPGPARTIPPPAASTQAAPTGTLMPDLVGIHVDEAKDFLEGAGFEVDEVKRAAPGFDKDIVFATAPSAEGELVTGQTITLFVSDGKEEVPGRGKAKGHDDDDDDDD